MKCLIISTLFPPDMLGGAELACSELAKWLVEQGHEVHVLTTAKAQDEQLEGEKINGLNMWRIYMSRPYPAFFHPSNGGVKKMIWHIQDHFDPRNESLVDKILDQVNPDVVNIHCIQGFGYNALGLLARRKLPVVFTLHDLGLTCIKMNMFAGGKNCAQQGFLCSLSARYKWAFLNKIQRKAFVSPSSALLGRLAEFTPIRKSNCRVVKYVTSFPLIDTAPNVHSPIRFLYVGRIHDTKGVRFLLEIFDELSRLGDFRVTLVGGGNELEGLRRDLQARTWINFVGPVHSSQVRSYLLDADILCVPSLWFENSPLVIYEAFHCGLPVIASRIGGIPELVQQNVNGRLVDAGNHDEWKSALKDLISNPEQLKSLRAGVARLRLQINPNALGKRMVEIYEETCRVV